MLCGLPKAQILTVVVTLQIFFCLDTLDNRNQFRESYSAIINFVHACCYTVRQFLITGRSFVNEETYAAGRGDNKYSATLQRTRNNFMGEGRGEFVLLRGKQ